jgi:hypothetical protein
MAVAIASSVVNFVNPPGQGGNGIWQLLHATAANKLLAPLLLEQMASACVKTARLRDLAKILGKTWHYKVEGRLTVTQVRRPWTGHFCSGRQEPS